MFKKILISFLLFTTLFTSVFAKPTFAQSTAPQWYHSDFPDWFSKVSDQNNPEDIFAERYTSAQVEWVFYGAFAFILNSQLGTNLAVCLIDNYRDALAGISILTACPSEIEGLLNNVRDLLTVNFGAQNDPVIANKGFLQTVFLEDRAISGITYLREKTNQFNPIQEVKAQASGFGFEAAEPVRLLWSASRDITYFILVLAIIVMAFMIMFRVKNSPQTVVTIQSTLPKLIVAIVLITFSYAIAGLMIDLMYVVIGVFAGVLANSGLFTPPNHEWPGMYADLSGTQTGSGLAGLMRWYGIFFLISSFTNGVLQIGNLMTGGIGGILLVIIMTITLIIIMFKIAWALIKNFVTILLLIAGGPFMIISGVIGGSGVGGWLKSLAAHLAVYPAIGVMFAMAFFFLGNSFPDAAIVSWLWGFVANMIPFDPNSTILQGNQWIPPFTSVVGTNLNTVWLVISLVIISLIPKVMEIIQSALSGKPFAYGSAVGAPMAAASGMVAAPLAPIGQMFAQKQKDFWDTKYSELKDFYVSRNKVSRQ